ncbi:MAG: sulfate reduction electron transfer complex DsrMKJOP subunit DsrJ [Acidobacteriota bacterium]
MRDRGKIITGLAIFVGVALLPFWSNVSRAVVKPEPKIVTKEKACILPTQEMRDSHMELLNRWRNTVVRDGERTYVAADGKTIRMSLSATCMSCHPNKKEFCDRCHNYLAVSPYCWECHVEPKEKT